MTAHGLPLEIRFFSKVTKTDICWEWTGAKTDKGYGVIKVDGKVLYAHRVSYQLAHGSIPDEKFLDHKCWRRDCVRPDHLRPVTPKQNSENQQGAPAHNTSGFRGVTWDKMSRSWRAYAKHYNTFVHAGQFTVLEEAAEAARQLRLSLHTHNDADRRSA